MNAPKAQHFIPCLHLKHFAGSTPQGHVWTYDKQTGKVRSSIPQETAFENNFYSAEKPDGTMDTRLEQCLAEIESAAAPVYEALLHGKIPGETQARADYATFLAIMYARTPAMRRIRGEAYGRFLQIQSYAYGAHPTAFKKLIQDYESDTGKTIDLEMRENLRRDMLDPSGYIFEVPKEITLSALKIADELAPIFFRMRWTLLRPVHGFFITSDNPLMRDVDPKSYSPIYGDGGFLNKTAEIVFPLSPDLILFMARDKQGQGITTCKREFVDGVNKALAACADRYLYAHISHKNILRLATQFRDSRTGITIQGFGPKKFGKVRIKRRAKQQEAVCKES